VSRAERLAASAFDVHARGAIMRNAVAGSSPFAERRALDARIVRSDNETFDGVISIYLTLTTP